MKQYLVEALGIFFVVMVTSLGAGGLAIGLMYMAMMYMGSHISGGHFNPSVTLAMYLRGGSIVGSALGYLLAQIVGVFAVAGFFYAMTGSLLVFEMPAGLSIVAFVFELLAAFAFCSVFLIAVTTDRLRAAAGLAPLVIGFSLVGSLMLPNILLNPALGIVSAILNLIQGNVAAMLHNLIIQVVASFVGAALAAYWFRYINHIEVHPSGAGSHYPQP